MVARMAGVLGSVAVLLLAAPVLAALAATKLAPNEIQTTFFNGQPFSAATNSNVKFKMTFTADGKMTRVSANGGAKGEGTWTLSKDGFCSTWKGAGANCFTVVSAGNNKWSVLKGSTIMATWNK